MTVPKIQTLKKQGSRFYVHPTKELEAIGVTSALNMLPKEFLKFWAAKLVAETAVDNVGATVTMLVNGDRDGAIDYLKRAPMRNTGKAADNGSAAHDLFERLASGEKLTKRDVHPDMQVYVDHFREFMKQTQFEPMFLEGTVWSETHGYAGSFDAIGYVTVKGERSLLLIDWKTTRSGVHAEVCLQLNAYAGADYIVNEDGEQVPIPALDGLAVFHVRPEGWQLVPVALDTELYLGVFQGLQKVLEWEKTLKNRALGNPVLSGGNPVS